MICDNEECSKAKSGVVYQPANLISTTRRGRIVPTTYRGTFLLTTLVPKENACHAT
jgi:hypothetical protein